MKIPKKPWPLLLLLILLAGATACTSQHPPAPSPTRASQPTSTPWPTANVTFRAHVPDNTHGQVALEVLDEVTGLAFNAQRHPMQAVEGGLYQVTIPCPQGILLKYRYVRLLPSGQTVPEAPAGGMTGRYRVLRVDGTMDNEDIIARWQDGRYPGATGRVEGTVLDEQGHPVADMVITAGGVQTVSLADGSFVLDGLPVGEHTLVAYHIDGRYTSFQHRVKIAAHSMTPAPIQVTSRPLVPVQFTVITPDDTVPGAPVRLVGNLYALGNTYGDQGGSLSVLSSRAPTLQPAGERRYTLTLQLPVGAEVRYKYTLGDGFWNAEHDAEGKFVVRHLIVPPQGGQFTDQVTTWHSGDKHAVWFEVNVPPETPAGDVVDIQFDVGLPLPPLPMWPLREHQWGYLLSGPTNVASEIRYRFCRNEQCGVADQQDAAGPRGGGHFDFTLTPQQLEDDIRWQWWQNAPQANPPQKQVQPRPSGFWSGIGLMPAYRPTWQPYMGRAMAEIRRLHARWVVLTPTWTATSPNDAVLWVPRLGTDPLVTDITAMSAEAQRRGLHTALYPTIRFPQSKATWWGEQTHDFMWWMAWFNRYTAFARHFARLAQQTQASALVLGGAWVQPALVGGTLPNGQPAGTPADANRRWRAILTEVHHLYAGPVYWALPLEALRQPPPFLDAVDGIVVLWSPNLGGDPGGWPAASAALLQSDLQPFAKAVGKPIVLAVAYPSAAGVAGGCVPAAKGTCLPQEQLFPHTPTAHRIGVALARQRAAYAALLAAVNDAPWVQGVVSMDFYPPAALQGPSASVYGKPAADVLRWWFSQWTP